MTFGDVLAITLLIVVTVVTLWAGIVAFTVVFSRRAQMAANALTDTPGKQIGIGALVALISGTLSVVLMGRGGPIAALGFAILAAALAVAVLGSAGLALAIAVRLRELDARYSPLSATTRGAALAVAAGLIPIIGWFFLMPAALFASLGAGFTAMRTKKQTAPQSEPQAIPVAAAAEM
ncbi:MAG: hypothetical protein H8F28_19370 [Fibrella sp.]|nr:hypothetical protein [Armatimonadota bacterium]